MDYSRAICRALHDDHMATVRVLEALETQFSKIGRKEPPDPADPALARLLRDVQNVMRGEITSHFAFEEENLFPLAEEVGADPMVDILRGEHETIRPLAEKVNDAIGTFQKGSVTLDGWTALYDLGLEIAEREIFHIQKEEMGFLPMLEQVIDPDDDGDLALAFAESR